MFDEEDAELLRKVKSYSAKKRRSFSSVINSKNLTEEEMDELFLG